jgi:PadR family transcriptional regulator PadR
LCRPFEIAPVMTGLRLTPQTVLVVSALLATPDTPRWGRDISKTTGLASGTLHPILARLEKVGWVESYWEDVSSSEDLGRPRRRYYRFTDDGAEIARDTLADLARVTQTSRSTQLLPQPGY